MTVPAAISPHELLWEDVHRLEMAQPSARAFLLDEGVISIGYSLKRRIKELRQIFPEKTVCVRPTGGGIVEHGRDVCFGMSVPGKRSYLNRVKVYITAGKSLADFLRKHFSVRVEIGTEVAKEGFMCYSMHAPGELSWHGRKLCGMAMRIFDSGYIIQGTIILKPLKNCEDVAAIEEICGGEISRTEFAQKLTVWLERKTLPLLVNERQPKNTCAV